MSACGCCGSALGPVGIQSPDRLHGVPGSFGVAECGSCGSGRTLPVADEEGLTAFYPSAYVPHGDAEGSRVAGAAALGSRAIRAWQASRMLASPALSAGRSLRPGRALDVGCGRGDLGAVLVERGWRVDGVEPSREACAAARERGVNAQPGTLASVSLEPEAYDLVTFVHSLEHTVEPVADLKRVAAAMRPGATVAVVVPHFGGAQARLFRGRWFHLDVPRHRHHFTAEGLRRALVETGLEVRRTATSTSAIGLAGSLQYALLGRWALREGLGFRLTAALSQATWPLARLFDLLLGRYGLAGRGGGDLLHAVARRR